MFKLNSMNFTMDKPYGDDYEMMILIKIDVFNNMKEMVICKL